MISCNRKSSATLVENNINTNRKIAVNDNSEKEILLEVYTNSEGMVDPSGMLLDLRLYSTGEVDYENYLNSLNGGDTYKKLRKGVMLNKENFEELKKLIEMPDFVKAKTRFKSTMFFSDVLTTTTIVFKYKGKEKKITLEETDTHLHLDKKKDVYPKSLITLLQLITKVKIDLERSVQKSVESEV